MKYKYIIFDFNGTIIDDVQLCLDLLNEILKLEELPLVDMEKYIPSDNINNIILYLTEADMSGNGVINNLYTQIDYIREKRKMEIKSEISKVPIKISVISVLFFIPLILLIILAPVILSYIG